MSQADVIHFPFSLQIINLNFLSSTFSFEHVHCLEIVYVSNNNITPPSLCGQSQSASSYNTMPALNYKQSSHWLVVTKLQ